MASKKELHPNIQGGQSHSVPSLSLSSARKIRRPPCPDWTAVRPLLRPRRIRHMSSFRRSFIQTSRVAREPLRPFFFSEQRPCRIRQGLARIGRRVGLEARCSVPMPSHILPSS